MNQILTGTRGLSYLDQSADVKMRFERMKTRETILEVCHLEKIFTAGKRETVALHDINFSTYRREFLCVVGPSGCGKSTLVRILAGLQKQSAGEVLLEGKPGEGPGSDRGMVFQGYTLFPWLNVKKNVMLGLEINGYGATEAERQALQWLQLVGLEKFQNAYPHQLSGGMKQRVAIVRALANQPRILLMDEPFGALDAQTRCRMQAHLLEIWRKIEITVPRPRSASQFVMPEFLATKARLEELIYSAPVADAARALRSIPALR